MKMNLKKWFIVVKMQSDISAKAENSTIHF